VGESNSQLQCVANRAVSNKINTNLLVRLLRAYNGSGQLKLFTKCGTAWILVPKTLQVWEISDFLHLSVRGRSK